MKRLLLTPRWIAFTVLMAVVAAACMALGWWQFQRYREGGGSFQNLGYTLNWPLFGAFAGYLWWRLLRDAAVDESTEARGEATAGAEGAPGSAPHEAGSEAAVDTATGSAPRAEAAAVSVPAQASERSGSPSGASPSPDEEDDPELAAYNRYLAALAERTRR